MFSLYISNVGLAGDVKTFVGTMGDDEPMDELANNITKAIGFRPEGLLLDLISTPLYHTDSDEYRVCLTYNTFFLMTLHDDDKACEIFDMLDGLRTERLAAPLEIVSPQQFEKLLDAQTQEVDQESYRYAKELHKFHCNAVCLSVE